MVQVIWSAKAENHLFEIAQYIARNSQEQAIRVSGLIYDSTEVLEIHPEFGAVVPECGDPMVRELRVFQYRIFYRITNDGQRIDILSVYHGARELTDEQIDV